MIHVPGSQDNFIHFLYLENRDKGFVRTGPICFISSYTVSTSVITTAYTHLFNFLVNV